MYEYESVKDAREIKRRDLFLANYGFLAQTSSRAISFLALMNSDHLKVNSSFRLKYFTARSGGVDLLLDN